MILKLKRTPGLYLVGFMACGKTTVGISLAYELGWSFSDIDTEIEAHMGKTIVQIFREHGESAFREIETELIRKRVSRIEAGNPCVVAPGGGAFAQPKNWELIENNGVTIWLDCPFDILCKRLDNDTARPLATNRSSLERLFQERQRHYSRADFSVPADTDNPLDVVRNILALPIF